MATVETFTPDTDDHRFDMIVGGVRAPIEYAREHPGEYVAPPAPVEVGSYDLDALVPKPLVLSANPNN